LSALRINTYSSVGVTLAETVCVFFSSELRLFIVLCTQKIPAEAGQVGEYAMRRWLKIVMLHLDLYVQAKLMAASIPVEHGHLIVRRALHKAHHLAFDPNKLLFANTRPKSRKRLHIVLAHIWLGCLGRHVIFPCAYITI
jgi:hypothetical protein